jgi:2,3,4,5-tetrahydropyridine-2-carboxylate N-succinyltransferase
MRSCARSTRASPQPEATMDTRTLIEQAFEDRASLGPGKAPRELLAALGECLELLGSGRARVAEQAPDGWRVNEWLKKAVLLHFRVHDNAVQEAGVFRYFDKLSLKHADYDAARFRADGARIVPGAIVRQGAHVARDAVLMPCFVNVGAYVGAGTMVDTWATVGSCAQIGRNVHLSGGVGIGGVLEPLQARPTIVEDECFIGARSEVVEGVIVERGAVLSMGVFLGSSTRIYDRETREISYGRIPAGAVVVPGSLPAPDGSHSLYCAVIVKKVDAQTRAKTSINELLRN